MARIDCQTPAKLIGALDRADYQSFLTEYGITEEDVCAVTYSGERHYLPMMTERQIVDFYMHASSLDKLRLEHQLEALRE